MPLTFRPHLATQPGQITIEVVRESASEITGVRLPPALHGHGEKTWRRDEITVEQPPLFTAPQTIPGQIAMATDPRPGR